MAGTACDDAPLEGTADEGHVAHHVEQLVACGLVLEVERTVVDISQVGHLFVLHADEVGDVVEGGLRHLAVVDHDGIVEVTALDEVGLQ